MNNTVMNVAAGSGGSVEGLSYIPVEVDLPSGDLWIFGYGSLMWNPGFPYLRWETARLYGFHRSLCVWSWVHRGTQARPGLVMGLDRGGCCIGRAYLIAEKNRPDILDYLYRREMATPIYVPRRRRLTLESGAKTDGLVFNLDRQNPQYAGKLSVSQAAQVVRQARGRSGANPDYVIDAAEHFASLGLHAPWFDALRAEISTPE